MTRYLIIAVMLAAAGCGRTTPSATSTDKPGSAGASSTSTSPPGTATGPIDVCRIITDADAAALLGPLPQQPPAKTDNIGFGISVCMYVGPALSGQGAQTVLTRLTIQAGRGKNPADMLQDDVDKRRATTTLSGVGDSAKRNDAGSFVWATKGGVTCTAEISNGLPPTLTPDKAAQGLGRLCGKVLDDTTK